MGHDVFISHSARDKPYADAVCAKLESRGIRCWIAPRDIRPGMEWGAAILGAIDGARVMLLVFSAHSNGSPQISREVERAVHKGLVVIPIRIEDVAPSGNLEYFLGTPHWLDAITRPFERHLDGIADAANFWLERLQSDLSGEPRAPLAVPPQPARIKPPIESDFSPTRTKARSKWLISTMVALMIAVLGAAGFFAVRFYTSNLKQAEKRAAEQAVAAEREHGQKVQREQAAAAEKERQRQIAEKAEQERQRTAAQQAQKDSQRKQADAEARAIRARDSYKLREAKEEQLRQQEAESNSTPAAADGTFHSALEEKIRGLPFVGPKVTAINWPENLKATVMLDNCPLEQMPPFAKEKFLGDLRDAIISAKAANRVTDTVEVDLIDASTGRLMQRLIKF